MQKIFDFTFHAIICCLWIFRLGAIDTNNVRIFLDIYLFLKILSEPCGFHPNSFFRLLIQFFKLLNFSNFYG